MRKLNGPPRTLSMSRLARLSRRQPNAPILRLLCSAPPRPASDDEKQPAAAANASWRTRTRAAWAARHSDARLTAICVSTFALMTGHGVATPVMVPFSDSLGATFAEVGLAISAFAAARMVLNVPLGLAADKYGRKPLMVGGALLSAVGMSGCGIAESVSELLVWRFIAGAGNAAYLGGAQVALQDISTDRNRGRVMSTNHAALLCGVSAGPALGGMVAMGCGLRAPFFLVGGFGLVTAAWAALRMEETLPKTAAATEESKNKGQGTEGSKYAAARLLLSDPRFLAAGLAQASSFAMRQGGRNVLWALLAVNSFGYDAGKLGGAFAAMAAVDLLFVAPTAWLSDKNRHDRRKVIVPGVLLAAAALGAVSTVEPGGALEGENAQHAFIGLTCLWALATASQGYSLPTLAADVTPKAHRGLGTSLFRTAGDIGCVARCCCCCCWRCLRRCC